MIEQFLKNKPIKYSLQAQEAYKMVNRPFRERDNADYNFDFLNNYEPNKTFFLSEKIRNDLYSIGNLRETQNKELSATTKSIYVSLLVDFSYASSKLEGNTYSYADTKTLIEKGKVSSKNSNKETIMILNHKNAIEFILSNIDRINYDSFTVKNIHAYLAYKLLQNNNAVGKIRKSAVCIGNSGYLPLVKSDEIEDELDKIMKKASQIKDPFEQSFFLLTFIAYLQAFEDVNKRTSRVFCNIPLIKNRLCPISFLQVNPKDYTSAMLAVYEYNDTSILQDLYVSMYESSVIKYMAIDKNEQENIPDDDFVRLRSEVFKCVNQIIKNCIDADYYIDHLNCSTQDKVSLKKYVNESLDYLSDSDLFIYDISLEDLQKYQEYKQNSVMRM